MNSQTTDNWGGVVLCGGRAIRMGGRNKAIIKVGGRRLLDIAVSELSSSLSNIALCGGQEKLAPLNIPTLYDREIDGSTVGPAGALLAAIDWAESEKLAGVITLPVDTPILPKTLCASLVSAGGPAYASQKSRNHWLHAAWPIEVFPLLKAAILEDRTFALHRLHERIGSRPVLFPLVRTGEFHNINTFEDLAQAVLLLGV